jgi:hypothetical protein
MREKVAAMAATDRSGIRTTLIIIVVVGLAVDAYVHLHLASAFSQVKTSTLSQADLFRVEVAAAIVAAVALALRPRRYTAAAAFLVAAAGFVAVVLYRYVDVGAIGPIPNMYDPYWAPAEKALSAIAEGVAALAAAALFLLLHADAANNERLGHVPAERPARRRLSRRSSSPV